MHLLAYKVVVHAILVEIKSGALSRFEDLCKIHLVF